MYNEFFGLNNPPFESTPDPYFLFLSKQHREVLSSLLYAVESAKGLVLVAGDVGTGKTTLIHTLLKNIKQKHSIIHIVNPRTHFYDILRYIAKKIGVPTKGLNTPDWIDLIYSSLKQQNAVGKRAVLIIDEAHLLTEGNLENVRLLLNLETEKSKLLQIILVGQNEIYDTLQMDSLKSLKQRIVINRKLESLNQRDTQLYIQHRLKIAGRTGMLFNKGAMFWIWKASNGIPRLINQICDNALLIGFAEGKQVVGKKIIKEVINDMQSNYRSPAGKPDRLKWQYAAITGFIIIAFAFLAGIGMRNQKTEESQLNIPAQAFIKRNQSTSVIHSMTEISVKIDTENDVSSREDLNQGIDDIINNQIVSGLKKDFYAVKDIYREEKAKPVITLQSNVDEKKTAEIFQLKSTPVNGRINGIFSGNNRPKGLQRVVNHNDNLSDIIIKEYGYLNETLMDIVLIANSQITNPNLLFPGQKIILPKIEKDDIVIQNSQGAFHIYYASLNELEKAKKEVEKLKQNREKAFVVTSKQAGNLIYRIYIGEFPSRGDAEKVLGSIPFKYLPPMDE